MNRDSATRNLIVVCGPTASGKTRLGIALALAFDGEIISVDSRQVYRGMDIGTGKDLHDYHTSQGNVTHHLIDIIDPGEIYTLYQFQKHFYHAFSDIRNRFSIPIAVGGTGLYLEAVLRNYAIPAVPENTELRGELMGRSKEWLESHLLALSPEIHHRTDCSSIKRLVRAIEIAICSPSPQANTPAAAPDIKPVVLCVSWERHRLHERIDSRLMQRLQDGMVGEVELLLKSGISPERFALFGMEYKHIARYLQKAVIYEKMVTDLRRDIHQLAKRQETWFRGMERRGIPVHWIPEANLDMSLSVLKDFDFQR